MFKKIRVRREALPLLNLCYLDWTTVCSMQLAVRDVRSASALSVTARGRVARSFHFHRLSRDPLEQLQWTTSLREGYLHATIAPNAFSSRSSVVRGLSPKVGSAAVRFAAKLCPQRDRRNNTPLGQRSPGDWTRCFKLWRRRPCSAT